MKTKSRNLPTANRIPVLLTILWTSLSQSAYTQKVSYEDYDIDNLGDGLSAQLGTFEVFQDQLSKEGTTIKLAFVKLYSENHAGGYPTIYLAGGPGGSGISAALGRRKSLFEQLTKAGDVIAFDQRGTGKSSPFPTCSKVLDVPLAEPFDVDDYVRQVGAVLPACIVEWQQAGLDFCMFNSRQSAADLESLRLALGVDKINLWGISYGTHLGLAYLKYYPNRVDKVVFAGLEGLDQTVKQPVHLDQYLARVNERLQVNADYRALVPDLKGLMRSVFVQLEESPLLVETKHPRSGQAVTVAIGKEDLQLFTSFYLLKNPRELSQLPLIFIAFQSGQVEEIAPYFALFKPYLNELDGMSMAMDAMSGISGGLMKQINAQEPEATLGLMHNFPFPQLWNHYDFDVLDDEFRAHFEIDTPALLLSGELDGRTPLESTQAVRNQFTNAKHIVVKDAGHDLFMSSPTVGKAILDFLLGKDIAIEEITDLPPFQFITP